ALLLLAPAALADEPRKPGRKRALKEYQERLLAQRETLDLGALKVTVTLVHDHFVYRMIDELLASDDLDARPVDALAEQVARMAERRKASMGKPALLVRFECASTPRSFVAFEGKLDDVLRV